MEPASDFQRSLSWTVVSQPLRQPAARKGQRNSPVPTARQNLSILAACLCAALMPAVASFTSAQNIAPPQASTPATPIYDVMSIKPNKSGSGSTDIDSDDGRFSAKNVPLKTLLAQAYDIKEDLISAFPGPVDSARFDIEAKVVDPDPAAIKEMTREQRRQMLLPLLTDRFRLKTHIEVKTLPVYELVAAKGGPKFKPSADQARTGSGSMSVNGSRVLVKLSAHDVSIESLCKALARNVDRTVIDKTGLTGNFDLDLQWSKDDNPDADAPPTIFTAIEEQLGLKLQPGKGPVATLVVDHAEMPSEN